MIGHVNLQSSRLQRPVDRTRHFQPRGLAVTKNSKRLLVTSFFSFTRPGGKQANDNGREGVVCRLNVSTSSKRIRELPRRRPRSRSRRRSPASRSTPPAMACPTRPSAFPNQLQSIVIRGNQAYLPNIAASPIGPAAVQRRHAGVRERDRQARSSGTPVDAGAAKFLNLHLGARQPETGKKKLFFANPWAHRLHEADSGSGTGYVVSSGQRPAGEGQRGRAPGSSTNTVDADTTRYIDLNDPANPATSGDNAGKNPQGIAINKQGTRAYVANFVSRNVSVVDLTQDSVADDDPHRAAARARLARGGRDRRAPRCSSPRAATSTGRRARPSRRPSGCRARAGRAAPAATSRGSPTASSGSSAPARASRCR